jgi:hypothetical protein
MGKSVKVIEENEVLTVKYLKKIRPWSFSGMLSTIIFLAAIMGGIGNLTDFGLGWFCFTIAVGATFYIPVMLKNREISLTVDENFITIEYPSSKNNGEEVIKKMFANEDIKHISTRSKNNHHEFWIENFKGEKTLLLGGKEGFLVEEDKDVYETLDKITDFFDKKRYLKARKAAIQKISTPKVKVVKSIPTKKIITARQIDKEQDTAKLKIQDLREGVLVDFHNEHWEIIGQVQYDWKLENTDMLYQVKNHKNQITFLFIAQNIAVYTAWIEERLSQYELMSNQLDSIAENPPLKFTFRESVFLKEHFNSGHEFASKSKNGVKIKQWKYLSQDRKESLRILEHEDKDTFVFWGEKIEEFEFSNILTS